MVLDVFDAVLHCLCTRGIKHLQVERYRRCGINKLIITLDIGILLAFAFGFSQCYHVE
jgi:hypothetical protein